MNKMQKKVESTTIPDKVPKFYDDDIQKWHNKFEKSIKEREIKKKGMMTT